jgi:hypothetical protein
MKYFHLDKPTLTGLIPKGQPGKMNFRPCLDLKFKSPDGARVVSTRSASGEFSR